MVHLRRSTYQAISGWGDWSTRILLSSHTSGVREVINVDGFGRVRDPNFGYLLGAGGEELGDERDGPQLLYENEIKLKPYMKRESN